MNKLILITMGMALSFSFHAKADKANDLLQSAKRCQSHRITIDDCFFGLEEADTDPETRLIIENLASCQAIKADLKKCLKNSLETKTTSVNF